MAFIKPNYIISKKTAKLSGTEALLQVWGEAMLLAAAKQLYVRYCSRPGLSEQCCSAWGMVPAQGEWAQGNGHRLPLA